MTSTPYTGGHTVAHGVASDRRRYDKSGLNTGYPRDEVATTSLGLALSMVRVPALNLYFIGNHREGELTMHW